MDNKDSISAQQMGLLSRLMFRGYWGKFDQPVSDLSWIRPDLAQLAALSDEDLSALRHAADVHHVVVRAFEVLRRGAVENKHTRISQWCDSVLREERARISHAVERLGPICDALVSSGCEVTVIKSLDHWPDLGSDLDLYTTGDPDTVVRTMQEKLNAELEPRSWGDRLANKWNFAVPGLPELIEIHVRYLGQTGEHLAMARRVVERANLRQIGGHNFRVAAPEERIVISTLQRMYRHFYFRLCDMADFAALLQRDEVDFAELRRAAEAGGIWTGVATFLYLVQRYANEYGAGVTVPAQVLSASRSRNIGVQLRNNFLRVPMGPAASLYGTQLLNAGLNGDFRAVSRLPLLPPLALTALLAYRVTGSDKGIW